MSPKDAIRVIIIWNRSLLLAVLLVFPAILRSQDRSPSQTARTIVPTEAIQPEYQSSGNMAILDRIPGQASRIRSVSIGDTLRLLIFPKYHYWEFYQLDSLNRLKYYGRLLLDSTGLDYDYYPGDIESITYGNGSVRLFLDIQKSGASKIISMPLSNNNLDLVRASAKYHQISDTLIDRLSFGNIEMIHQFDGRLFLASNINILYMYDVSTETSFTRSTIELTPSLPTFHHPAREPVKIHEVKGFKRENGERLVGLGLPRYGICILTFDQNWSLADTKYQYYEFDRTLFPDTIINPNKAYFDTAYYMSEDRMRNHKWDWNVCHSIIPYDDGNGKYVVTTDEFTWYPAYKDYTNAWMKGTLEAPDFYMPDTILAVFTQDFGFYNGQRVTALPDRPVSYALQENEDHRLSWMRRNHPMHPGTDPNKFQGAFLRIFDRDSIGNNTLSANNGGMILNAYDVGEDPADQIGCFGKRNIPDTSIVAGGGLHEIILSGNRLYLAGYNNGARVLDLRGSDMKLLGYCRTEKYLSNDTSSSDFYLRPDIVMYAKGPYRLIPDRERDDILFANDLYNGVWIYRFFDSTLADTIRHIAFQTRVDLGTVDPSHPRTFDIAGSAVIACDASVRFLDNTTFNFRNFDTLNVLGTLEIGQTTFNAPTEISPSRIRAKDGSTLLLGGCDKTINGLPTVTIDSGATGRILAGSIINMMSAGTLYVGGTLYVDSCNVNSNFKIVCRNRGTVVIEEGALVTGLKTLIVEDGGTLQIRDKSVVRMERAGSILIQGTFDSRGIHWARIQSRYAQPDTFPAFADYWYGLEFDHNRDTTSTLHNLCIHHGYPGVWTHATQPLIDSCTFSWNYIGLQSYDDSPVIQYNRFEHNDFAGLNGVFMSTVIRSNRFNANNKTLNGGAGNGRGAFLYHCGNLWLDNRLDSNYIGLDAFEWVTVPFNPSAGSCDTSNGTSMRENNIGVWTQDNSALEFNGDNSVHDNVDAGTGKDFILETGTSVMGTCNYPDSSFVQKILHAGSTFVWSGPTPAIDPVLLKSAVPSANPCYAQNMNLAAYHRSLRQYSSAAASYQAALACVRARVEAEHCIRAWSQLFTDARLNAPSQDAMSVSPVLFRQHFMDALSTLEASADSLWLRVTAKEMLAFEYLRRNETQDAQTRFIALADMRNTEPVIAKRALLAVVVLRTGAFRNPDSAMSAYVFLSQYYPGTRALMYAKVLLRLPLTAEDEDAMRPMMPKAVNEEAPDVYAMPENEGLAHPWPNPFTTRTKLQYKIDVAGMVRLSIYNNAGMEIRRLVSSELAAGEYSVLFERGTLPAGIYSCRLEISGSGKEPSRVYVKGLILIK